MNLRECPNAPVAGRGRRRRLPSALPALVWLALLPAAARAAERVTVWLPPAAELAVEDAQRDAEGLPWRYALPQAVRVTPARDGAWSRLPDGSRRWRLEVASPGALSLNLGFTVYWLPRGAVLSLRPAAGDVPPVEFDDGDNADHGELWTPAVAGDRLTVELFVPAGASPEPLLELGFVNAGYRFFGDAPAAKSGACNVDVICPEGDPWREQIAAVGLVSVNGAFICTGALVNNTAIDARPYFLTANHCGITGPLAPSVVVYWNFESPVCGQHGGGSFAQFTSGSLLRATWSTSDFTLLELDQAPDPAFGVTYAGWNRGSALPTSAVAIHHPASDEKSISFENAPLRLTSYTGTAEPGDGTHLRIVDWDVGTTEPGSSGSPLFDQDQYVVGQLHGGYAACGNNESDWYGWLNRSWDGGGSAATRLRDWLDPGATGATTLPLLDPAAGEFTVAPVAGVTGGGTEGGPFTPSSWEFTLANAGTVAAGYTAAVDQAWLTVTPTSGTVAAGGIATVTVSLADAATGLAAGTRAATLTLANPARGSTETRTITLAVRSAAPAIVSVAPNPFRTWVVLRLSLPAGGAISWRVFDLQGRLVRGPVEQAGVPGDNDVAWDGHDDAGRRLPSGSYVLSVQAGGRELKAGVVGLH